MKGGKERTLKAVLVGCGGMGRKLAQALRALKEFDLTAVCDHEAEAARELAGDLGVKAYNHYGAMLRLERPHVAVICTSTATHADLTIQAAQSDVRGVYCEAPMATNMADARAMLAACRRRGAALVINHQRRLGADLVEARRLIEAGAIGEVKLVRANCGGDLLSDGTHMVDGIMWLLGDPEVHWAFGQVHREINDFVRELAAHQSVLTEPGYRNGRAIENGGIAVFEAGHGVWAELLWGDMHEEGRDYQDFEVFGSAGRLWRTNVRWPLNLFVQDASGGTWRAGRDEGCYKPVPIAGGGRGTWRPIEIRWDEELTDIERGCRLFAQAVQDGTPHPMSGQVALRSFEVLMAIFESARTRRRINLPLRQQENPLDLMIKAGDA